MSQNMRRLLKIAALLLLALLVIVPGCVLLNLSDPPIDDSDLRLERGDPDDPNNGLRRFDEVAATLWWPEEHQAALQAIAKGETWDEELVDEVLAKNGAALADALTLPDSNYLEYPAVILETLEIEDFNGVGWMKLAALLSIRSQREAGDYDSDASLASSILAVRIGDRAQRGKSANLLGAMIATGMKNRGLSSIEKNLPRIKMSADDARELEVTMSALAIDMDSWADAWKAEYEFSLSVLDSIAVADNPFVWEVNSGSLTRFPYLYKPNETKALFAERYRMMHIQSQEPCVHHGSTDTEDWSAWEKAKVFVGPNSVGKIMYHTGRASLETFERRRCSSDTRLAATIVMLALRAHEIENGEFPETLEHLVPRYLSAVPVDAFDGEPLSYDRAARTLGELRPDHTSPSSPSQFVVPKS